MHTHTQRDVVSEQAEIRANIRRRDSDTVSIFSLRAFSTFRKKNEEEEIADNRRSDSERRKENNIASIDVSVFPGHKGGDLRQVDRAGNLHALRDCFLLTIRLMILCEIRRN